MKPLQLKRGLKADLPASAALGEPLLTTDTHEMFVGTGTGLFKVGDIIFSDTEPAFVSGKVWIDSTNNKIYRSNDLDSSWVMISGGGTGAGTVSTDFTVYGVTQGIYADGAVVPAGTSLETVVKNMLQAIIPPTYQAPTLSLSGNGAGNIETGTTITPTLTPTWNQRDGGAPILYTLTKNAGNMVQNPSAQAFSDVSFAIGDEIITYQATETYNQGPVKVDNQGNPSPAGQIAAGTATSNPVTYAGKRALFYGPDTQLAAVANSADVRALPTKTLNPINGTGFTLNIPAGTTRVTIAYPDTLRALTSVKYVELGNGEVKDTFTLTQMNVEGAGGFAAVNYKVYSYIPAVPFGDAVTYVVTI